MAGLDPILGFVKRTTEDIVAQFAADEVAELSPSLDVSSSSPMGQLNGVIAKEAGLLWDLAEEVYVSMDPDRNTGDGQDAICAITGTSRNPATHSQVAVNLALGAGITIPQGSKMSVLGNPNAVFELRGPEPAPGDPVVEGDVVSVGAGTYSARFQAVATGPVVANAGTLTVIVTPVTGWTSATNPLDAALGEDIESPTALRIRREQELAAGGSTPIDALRAEMYQLLAAHDIDDGFVDVLENVDNVPDANGLPGHSIEVLIDDGPSPLANTDIAQVIWDGRAGGIQTYGLTAAAATDDLGVFRMMSFTRPAPVPIYFAVSIVIDPALFPGDGDTQVKEAMVAQGKLLKPGADVARALFFRPIFAIPGVINCTVLHLDTAPAPVSDADIAIAVRQRATFDTSRITITHV